VIVQTLGPEADLMSGYGGMGGDTEGCLQCADIVGSHQMPAHAFPAFLDMGPARWDTDGNNRAVHCGARSERLHEMCYTTEHSRDKEWDA
jgi:hypothetical protein